MKRILFFIILSCSLFCSACKKEQNTEGVDSINIESNFEDEDPDELVTEKEIEIEERASTFKILKAITNDSIPIWQVANPTKKQKYGKRQIVYTGKKTRFTLKGYGFKDRHPDSSYVKAYIQKNEQTGVEIVSWDSAQIVVDFPILTYTPAITKTFSISFKVFIANDKAGRTNISRSKSRTCISSNQAESLVGLGIKECEKNAFTYISNYRADSFSIPSKKTTPFNLPSINPAYQSMWKTTTGLGTAWTPQVGDILVRQIGEQGDIDQSFVGIILNPNANVNGDIFVLLKIYSCEATTKTTLGTARYKKVAVANRNYWHLQQQSIDFDDESYYIKEIFDPLTGKDFQAFLR